MLCLYIKGEKAIPQTKLNYRCSNNKQTIRKGITTVHTLQRLALAMKM